MLRPPSLIAYVTVKDLVCAGDDPRPLRKAPRDELIRLRRGVYADSPEWVASDPDRRYLARIAAVVSTRRTSVVLSHHAAACVWGLPTVSGWPAVVDLTERPDSARRSKNGVRIHRRRLGAGEIVRRGDFTVTSLERTLADLAAEAPFVDAVAALDAALDRRDVRVERDAIRTLLPAEGPPGRLRGERVLEFAAGLAMSPLESFSRVRIAELGFPAPVLQQEFEVRGGRSRFTDFWWPEMRVAGESDGRGRYAADLTKAMWEEKLREFEFLDLGVRFTRWGWEDCRNPQRLAVRLQAAGLRRTGRPLRAE